MHLEASGQLCTPPSCCPGGDPLGAWGSPLPPCLPPFPLPQANTKTQKDDKVMLQEVHDVLLQVSGEGSWRHSRA